MAWDIFEEFRRLQRRMERLFEELWPRGMLPALPEERYGKGELAVPESRRPVVDIIDGEREIRLIAELPGLDKDDIDIHITGDSIEISAESKQEAKVEEEGYIRRERRYARFYRRLPLPTSVDADKAKATYRNGILELVLPKKEPVKKQRIKID